MDVEALEGGYGLYLLAGRRKKKKANDIHYCGKTVQPFRTRLKNHHKVYKIKKDLEIWLGKIVFPDKPSDKDLKIAERILVYFWQPKLNEKLRYDPPPQPTNLISHWFTADGTPRRRQRAIYKDLHDVLCWDGELWRTGNLSVYEDY